MAEEAKARRQQEKEEREIAKKARAEELAANRELKKLQRDAATAQKSRDTLNKGKQKAAHKAVKIPAKRRRVAAAPAPPPPPPKSTRTRDVKTPKRNSE